MRRLLPALIVAACAAATAHAAPPLPATGKWLLSTVNAAAETAQAILKVETKDGNPTATVLFSPSRASTPTIKDFRATEKEISFTLVNGPVEQTFVGTPGPDGKTALGSFGTDAVLTRAKLSATDKESLDRSELSVPTPSGELYRKYTTLASKSTSLQLQAQREQDAEKRATLLKEATAAAREATAAAPGIFREIIATQKDSPSAYEAAINLIRSTGKRANPEEAAEWLGVVEQQAKTYGDRFARYAVVLATDTFAGEKALAPAALKAIEPVAKGLTDKDKAATQVKVLTVYRTALEAVGNTTELAPLDARLGKLDLQLDQEYLATVPPFKPEPYAGRKDKEANKVVVMELFTGAQCPPCVAADVAFDALEKSYKPTDLVLLQYHVHIPGPDPLTNLDTVARWDYYRATVPEGMRGAPSTVFNGKPQAGGGGGMANGLSKFNQYRGIIDPLLETKTDVKVSGTVGRAGDKLSATVTVTGAEPSEDLKLRLVVVEESIKYVGSNQIRFHHQVVRNLIGGPAGVAVNDKTFKHTGSADLADVKKGLNVYLDDYAIKTRPFPYKHRPMDLGHLKVIALVQNDKTLEILQAAQLEPGGNKTTTTTDQK